MKKLSLFLMLCCLLAGCAPKQVTEPDTPPTAEQTQPTTPDTPDSSDSSDIPATTDPQPAPFDPLTYTLEQAIADGCLVEEDGELTAGQDSLAHFLDDVANTTDTQLRSVHAYTPADSDITVLEIADIVYQDLTFTVTNYPTTAEESEQVHTYQYLIQESVLPTSPTDTYEKLDAVFLANDPEVTWEDILAGMLSSQLDATVDCYIVALGYEPMDPAILAVRQAVLAQDATANISAVTLYNDGYNHLDMDYIPWYNSFYMPEATNSVREMAYHELESKMAVDERGALVFVDNAVLPAYYVTPEGEVALVKSTLRKDDLARTYVDFLPIPSEKIATEYAQVLTEAQEKQKQTLTDLQNLQYSIVGDRLELTNSHVALMGTATRAYDNDTFSGQIRVALDSKADVTVLADDTVMVRAYSTLDEPGSTLKDGKWNGWQAYVSTTASSFSFDYADALAQLDNIALFQEILANVPPLEGDVYTYNLHGYEVSFTLPKSWSQQGDTCCNLANSMDSVTIAQDASHEYGGMLCSLYMVPATDSYEYPDYECLYTDGDYALLALYPTDVQFTPQAETAYRAMSEQLPRVIQSVAVRPLNP